MKEVTLLNKTIRFDNGNVFVDDSLTPITYEIGHKLIKRSPLQRKGGGDWDMIISYDGKSFPYGIYQAFSEEEFNHDMTWVAASRDSLTRLISEESKNIFDTYYKKNS